MINRIYLWGGIALAGALAVAGIWLHGNHHGKLSAQADMQASIDEARAESRGLADELEQANRERDRQRDTQVRTIYRESDPAGCADTPAISSVLSGLGYSANRPTTD